MRTTHQFDTALCWRIFENESSISDTLVQISRGRPRFRPADPRGPTPRRVRSPQRRTGHRPHSAPLETDSTPPEQVRSSSDKRLTTRPTGRSRRRWSVVFADRLESRTRSGPALVRGAHAFTLRSRRGSENRILAFKCLYNPFSTICASRSNRAKRSSAHE